LNPTEELSPARTRVVCCDVAAHAGVRVPHEGLAQLRRCPGPAFGEPLPPAFLKHSDEQAVVGLAAVLHAIEHHGLRPTNGEAPFADWAVVAAPRFLGRLTMVGALQRFADEGAWGVSPHLIPHRSLHSISGTVSLALKIRGPNFGAGGGPTAAAEALLAAAALIECRRVPGVWVVLTAMDPEEPPDEAGRPAPGTCFAGLAVALTPVGPGRGCTRLRVVSGVAGPPRGEPAGRAGFDLFRLHALLHSLEQARPAPTTLVQMLEDEPGVGSRLELSRGAGGAVNGRATALWPPRAAGVSPACGAGLPTAEAPR
jgi:hypothetical protein